MIVNIAAKSASVLLRIAIMSVEECRGQLKARTDALGHRSVRGRRADHSRPLQRDAAA
jgi:hypothetical protein